MGLLQDRKTKTKFCLVVRRSIAVLCVTGACGSVVVDNNACVYTNNDGGQPLDRYVGNYTTEQCTSFVLQNTLVVNEKR